MKDDTLLVLLGIGAAVYFLGPELKKIASGVGDAAAGAGAAASGIGNAVNKLSNAVGQTAENVSTYTKSPTPSANAVQVKQNGDDILYLTTSAIMNYNPGAIANQLFLRAIGQ